MNDEIREKILLAERWCEEAGGVPAFQAIAGNESTYCESGAVITGKRGEADRLDEELKKAMEAGSAEEAFKKAPLNGCLSVMTMARTKAGFNPADIDDTNASNKFLQYSKNLQSAPFFHLVSSNVSHMEHNEKNWDKVIDNVLDLYDGVSAGDKDAIRNSLGNIARAAMNKAGTTQTKNLFVQSEINYADEIKVFVFWAKIQMTYEAGKSTSTQEVIDISKLELQFDKIMWPYYAPMVLKYNVSFIEKWLEENAIPPQDGVAETVCFCRKFLKEN